MTRIEDILRLQRHLVKVYRIYWKANYRPYDDRLSDRAIRIAIRIHKEINVLKNMERISDSREAAIAYLSGDHA